MPTIQRSAHTINTEQLSQLLDAAPPAALAVLNIDSALIDVTPRTMAIMRSATRRFPEITGPLQKLEEQDLEWNAAQQIGRIAGLSAGRISALEAYWRGRFFSNAWLAYDRPYPGAVEFSAMLRSRNIAVIYLSGRDIPSMKAGTVESFEALGFPVGRGTRFFLKPDADTADTAFKAAACEEIRELGTVVLTLENEPEDANTFRRAFPGAHGLLIDTVCASDTVPADDAIEVFETYPEFY